MPSTAYTKYSIHRVQHTPSTTYTEYCIHHILYHPKIDCLTLPATLSSFSRPCCTQFSTFPQSRVNQWMESPLPSCIPPELPSAYCPPPSTPPISHDHGLQVHLPTGSITTCKCISNLLDHSLRWDPNVHSIPASQCMSRLTQSWPPNASLSSLNLGLQLNLRTRLMMASKCFTKFAQLCPRSASLSSLELGLLMRVQTRSITASQCISDFTKSRPPTAFPISHDHGL